jgi:hypothetical protein
MALYSRELNSYRKVETLIHIIDGQTEVKTVLSLFPLTRPSKGREGKERKVSTSGPIDRRILT